MKRDRYVVGYKADHYSYLYGTGDSAATAARSIRKANALLKTMGNPKIATIYKLVPIKIKL